MEKLVSHNFEEWGELVPLTNISVEEVFCVLLPLSQWTKDSLTSGFCLLCERLQSAFIPRSGDSSVVIDVYWIQLWVVMESNGNMTLRFTCYFSPLFWRDDEFHPSPFKLRNCWVWKRHWSQRIVTSMHSWFYRHFTAFWAHLSTANVDVNGLSHV